MFCLVFLINSSFTTISKLYFFSFFISIISCHSILPIDSNLELSIKQFWLIMMAFFCANNFTNERARILKYTNPINPINWILFDEVNAFRTKLWGFRINKTEKLRNAREKINPKIIFFLLCFIIFSNLDKYLFALMPRNFPAKKLRYMYFSHCRQLFLFL